MRLSTRSVRRPSAVSRAATHRQPLISDRDLRAMQQGKNCKMYQHLGAHLTEQNGVQGVHLAVWAPNAWEVCLINDANGWQHGAYYLNSSPSGVWSVFVPGVKPGEKYKFSIRTQWGELLEKTDPYGFAFELPPRTASIVADVFRFQWKDSEWMERRRRTNWLEAPMSIYEVHLGSWRRPHDGRRYFSYAELSRMLVDYCHEMGYTHLQLLPVTEHPFDGSWGYQATGYFAPTSRFGTPEDFKNFVDYCHQNNIGVLIDWVPAHFPTDAHSLGRFDGTACYEHLDSRRGFHPDWNTYIFNYGRFEVKDFLLSSARFWCEVYHIDGLRVDAVASMLYLDYSRQEGEWIPNKYGGRENLEAIEFLREMNTIVHGEFPGAITIAEESTAWPGVSRPVYDGGLGFTMKWDMGWMNDTLKYMRRDPIHRRHHQNALSFRQLYAFHENFVLPLSHDEVVHGKCSLLSQMPGDIWQKFANLRLLYGYQFMQPGKKLLFMGGELGQWTEWNHDAELDWALIGHHKHDGLRRYIGDLNQLLKSNPALYEVDTAPSGFSWISADDAANSVFAWCRHSKTGDNLCAVVINATPVPRHNYRIGVPRAGTYREILNSDAGIYGGSNIGNAGAVATEPLPMHGQTQSLNITLPPLGIVVFRPE